MLSRQTMGWVCVALAAGLLLVGWWPFCFHPVNHVGWLSERAGLYFTPDCIAYDPELLPVPPPEKPGAFTVELWVKPGLTPSNNVFHILTIDDGHRPSHLVLCQWQDGLLLRIPDNGNKRGFREVGESGLLQAEKERFITVSADVSETVFYAEGIQVARFPWQMAQARSLTGRLILGDSAEGKHPWTGQLLGVAVLSRALDAAEVAQRHAAWTNNLAASLAKGADLSALYLFDQRGGQWAEDSSPNRHRMFIPRHYEVLRKVVLSPPWLNLPLRRSDWDDVLINILGFVPFGFCVFRFRWLTVAENSLRRILFAVAIGTAVSFLIELVQVWLPYRSSSSTDLLCNIGGTLIGVLLARNFCSQMTATGKVK